MPSDIDFGKGTACRSIAEPAFISGYAFHEPIILAPLDPIFERDGILGASFFKHFEVDIDLTRHLIRLTPFLGR